MNKITGSLNDFRDILGIEIGIRIMEYNTQFALSKIARRLSVSPSFISLLSAGKFELISLKSMLSIATRLGIHYRIEFNNNLNDEKIEILYDLTYVKSRDRIEQFYHLDTTVLTPAPHFGRIDLQEAYQLFGLVKVDYDETYPHHTKMLQQWMDKWKPACPATPIATLEGENIRIHSSEFSLLCVVDTPRLIVTEATVILINLVRPSISDESDQQKIKNILNNIFTSPTVIIQQG